MQKRKRLISYIDIPVLLLGLTLSLSIAGFIYARTSMTSRQSAISVAEAELQSIEVAIKDNIYLSESLSLIIEASDGEVRDFNDLAQSIFESKSSVNSVQLAPDGVVTYVYPLEGNEAGRINLFEEEDRREEAIYARDTGTTVVSGPFELRQGGIGMVARRPVYLKNDAGEKEFWGFAIVVFRTAPLLESARVDELQSLGYSYSISAVTSDQPMVLASEGDLPSDAIVHTHNLYGKDWTITLAPSNGWASTTILYLVMALLIMASLMVSVMSKHLREFGRERHSLNEDVKKLQHEVSVDPLTGLLNRRGGDQKVMQYFAEEKPTQAVVVTLDIDKFKGINDTYGHDAGDEALKALAFSLRRHFGHNAIYTRNGGDEFVLFLYDKSRDEIVEKIHSFANDDHPFVFSGTQLSFTVSMGYSFYPDQDEVYSGLCKKADTALYTVKMNGKRGCALYDVSMNQAMRAQMSFNLTEIAEQMPGAMLVYRADESEEILYASAGMVRMMDCKDLDDFIQFTGRSFRGIVYHQDLDRVEREILSQIESPENGLEDQVQYRIQTASGKMLLVQDYGRLVESPRYGKVFFVMIGIAGKE